MHLFQKEYCAIILYIIYQHLLVTHLCFQKSDLSDMLEKGRIV